MEKSTDIEQARTGLQESMNFMGALAAGVEQSLGGPSNAMAFVAGKSLGKKFAATSPKTSDVKKALAEVSRILQDNHCLWQFETFQRSSQPELVIKGPDGTEEIILVFRDCMIRQSLFRFGHPQKGSLCYMMYGFFSGALEAIMGRKAELEITHAGQNACLKRLTLRPAQGR